MNAPNPTPGQSSPNRTRSNNGTRNPERKRPYLWIAAAAVVVLLLALAFRPNAISVEVGSVAHGPLTVSVLEEGKTRIRNRYAVSAPLSGLLRRTSLRPGDLIEAGTTVLVTMQTQPSAFLDPRSRAQAEAAAAAAEALVSLRQAEVERASASVDLMRKERQRAEALHSSGTISNQEWERVDAESVIRERELRAAEFALRVAEFEREQARAALLQGESTESRLFEVRSPISGVVLNVFEENARPVASGTPLIEVGDPADLELEVELLSQDAVTVTPGAELWIERWGGEESLRGRVSVVEPAAYTKVSALGVEEQRVKIRADFVDPLPAGQPLGDRFRIEARVIIWNSEDVLRIPTGALFRRGGEWMTYRVINGRATLTQVTIAHNSGTHAEVVSGVSAGDPVIVHPHDIVVEGSRIRARNPDGS